MDGCGSPASPSAARPTSCSIRRRRRRARIDGRGSDRRPRHVFGAPCHPTSSRRSDGRPACPSCSTRPTPSAPRHRRPARRRVRHRPRCSASARPSRWSRARAGWSPPTTPAWPSVSGSAATTATRATTTPASPGSTPGCPSCTRPSPSSRCSSWTTTWSARRELAALYRDLLAPLPGVSVQRVEPADESTYKDLTIIVDERLRRRPRPSRRRPERRGHRHPLLLLTAGPPPAGLSARSRRPTCRPPTDWPPGSSACHCGGPDRRRRRRRCRWCSHPSTSTPTSSAGSSREAARARPRDRWRRLHRLARGRRPRGRGRRRRRRRRPVERTNGERLTRADLVEADVADVATMERIAAGVRASCSTRRPTARCRGRSTVRSRPTGSTSGHA